MLLERSQAGSAVCVSKMAAKADSDEEEIHTTADDELDAASELKTDIQTPTRRKTSEAFEVDFGEPMPEKPTNNLQEAFKKFKKQRQAHRRNVHNPNLLLQPFFGLARSIVNVNTFDGWSLVVR